MRIDFDRHSDASLWKDAPTCANGRSTSKVSLAAPAAMPLATPLRNSAAVCGADVTQPASQIEHRAAPVPTAIAFAVVIAALFPPDTRARPQSPGIINRAPARLHLGHREACETVARCKPLRRIALCVRREAFARKNAIARLISSGTALPAGSSESVATAPGYGNS